MSLRPAGLERAVVVFAATASLFVLVCCARQSSAQPSPADLQLNVKSPSRFLVYGDTRFTDPGNTEAVNPQVRQALVQAMAAERPAFVSITGDIAYRGDHASDWKVWDEETAIWRERKIPVYPALGNHDLKGDEKVALDNYFQRFPDLEHSRYYSMRAGRVLLLALDSSQDETSGPQGDWLRQKVAKLSPDVQFVVLVMHHPPYTSSSDNRIGGGHSARTSEQNLARLLEEAQSHSRARFVVFSGHVHNYERHEHGGVTYFVTGGGGARPYLIEHVPGDAYQDGGINYHYLRVDVQDSAITVTMRKLELQDGKARWSEPDRIDLTLPAAKGSPHASADARAH
ncbi:MAG TPA: metallophosphoesterase [Acidobacteriota bacterium]|nr:metallophosphoesterase [Acidobacteriota bacterium]